MNHKVARRAWLGAPWALRAASPVRPNFVVILLDDARFDEFHCTGHPFLQSPNLDRIAAEGMTFRNAFVTTPLCSPSRASFMTGQYAHRHGIVDNTDRTPQSMRLETFPRVLQTAGYETAFVGKWHMGVSDDPRPGFDRWVGFQGQGTYVNPLLNVNGKHVQTTGYGTDILNNYAVDFLMARHEKPFLLYLAHKCVHPELTQYADGHVSDESGGTFLPAEKYRSLYAQAHFPRRPSAAVAPVDKPALQRKVEHLAPLGPATGTDDETIRNRARMLQSVDDGVERMFDVLERSGRLDDTVFVLTSDEGYFFGEHGLSFERRLAYEESIRIPLLVRYPQLIVKGSVCEAMALNIDLAPTLLELAGTRRNGAMQGRSLAPLLKGQKAPWRNSFLVEYYSDKVWPRVANMGYRCLRGERWKYIQYTDLQGMDELYDLDNDPYELKNLASDADAKVQLAAAQKELRRTLVATGTH